MNSIVSINKEEDISKITKETKYINIPIDIVDNNINNYFLITEKNPQLFFIEFQFSQHKTKLLLREHKQ